MEDQIKLYNDDCMNFLKTLEDGSIDCILTDPPYFIDQMGNDWKGINSTNINTNSHISHLPKGMKFDKIQTINLYNFYYDFSKICFSKLKPGGYFLSFSSPRLYHSIAMAVDNSGFEIRDTINWVYTQNMAKGMSFVHTIKKMDLEKSVKESMIEKFIYLKTPQLRSVFEPICVAMKPLKKGNTFLKNEIEFSTGLVNFNVKTGKEKIPSNIITTESINPDYDLNFLVSKPNKKEKEIFNTHLSVKPLALIEQLLKIFSKENSLILDPFLGSGTTALACKNTNRRCIGIEKDKESFDISLKRLFL